jgi:hypothetical protein
MRVRCTLLPAFIEVASHSPGATLHPPSSTIVQHKTEAPLLVALHHGAINKWGDFFEEDQHPYQNQELTPQDLAAHISTGHAWLAGHFDGKRHEQGYQASNLTVLDIDGDLSLEAFWALPFAQAHCLFTATTCSNRPEEPRFRAVFRIGEKISSIELHGAIYQLVLTRLGLTLKDNSGRKAERLWYGNSAAEFIWSAGVPLSSALVDEAEAMLEEAKAEAERRRALPSTIGAIDEQRVAWVLRHLLLPSQDGEYEGYWQVVLNAAAATGSELIRAAFFDWHHRGHHSSTQKRVEKRFDHSGRKMPAEGGYRKIYSLAKKQHGSGWTQALPGWLGWGGAESAPAISVFSFPRELDVIDPNSKAPDGGPSSISEEEASDGPQPNEPEAAPQQATADLKPGDAVIVGLERAIVIGRDEPPSPAPDDETLSNARELGKTLRNLYQLHTQGLVVSSNGRCRQYHDIEEFSTYNAELRGQLIAGKRFRDDAAIDKVLFSLFRNEHHFAIPNGNTCVKGLAEFGEQELEPLIPGLLMSGSSYLVYGQAGAGKTTLALALVRTILAAPGHNEFLGFTVPQSEWGSRRALYCASDGARESIKYIASYARQRGMFHAEWLSSRFVQFMAADPSDESTMHWQLSLRGISQLMTVLKDAQAEGRPYSVIIFDTLKTILPDHIRVGDQVVADFLDLIRDICHRFSVAQIYLHHQSKDSDTPQGIAALTERTADNFHLKKGEHGERIFCILKGRADGQGSREIPYSIEGDRIAQEESSTPYQPQELDQKHTAPILAVMQQHREQWLHANRLDGSTSVGYEGISRKQIIENYDRQYPDNPISDRTMMRILNAMIDTGRIHSTGHNRSTRYFIGRKPRHSNQPSLGPDLNPEFNDEEF